MRPREPGGEVVRELVADDMVGVLVPIRLELDLGAQLDRHAAALDAKAAAPDLVVDPPRSVLEHTAVAVRAKRDHVVEVHDRRLVVAVGELDVVEPVVAFLKLPVGDDRLQLVRVAVSVRLDARRRADRRRRVLLAGDADLVGQPEHPPDVAAPGTRADDEELSVDRALRGLDRLHEAVVQVDPRDLDAFEDLYALRAREPCEILDGLLRLRPATLALVQHGLDPFSVPVGEDRLHVLGAGAFAEHDIRAVADLCLVALDRNAILRLYLGNGGDVADAVEAEALWIRFEQLDRDANHFRHRRREVEVAHDAARDAGCARADMALLEDDDVLPRPFATCLEFAAQGGTRSRGRGRRLR